MLEKTGLFAESWNVAWRKKSADIIIDNKDKPFTVIKNSFRYWAADPFLFEYEGNTYIFCELYDYVKRRGILGYYQISDNKNRGKWIPIITEDYHMSYPFIVQKGNDIFILPETGSNNSLYVYKALQFPLKWEKYKILRENVKYGDTTPFVWKGKNLALTHQVEDPYNPKLYLLDMDNPEQDREIDIPDPQRRRPAGKVFEYKGKNIRPAQNCTEKYGGGLIFYEYGLKENDTEYWEKELCEIFPEQLSLTENLYLDGMHTYNQSEHYEVIDIKTRRFNILNFFFRVFGKLFH